jgi:hypothetical protein
LTSHGRAKSTASQASHVGIRVARVWSVTIKHASAVLVLVTIAAAPVTSVACVGWCFPTETPTSTACHHAPAALAISGADENCDSVLATSPFIKEEAQLITQAVLPASAPPSAIVSAAGEALLASDRGVDGVTPRSTSALVLRL